MKTVNDLNELTLRAFIAGVQETTERGDTIDTRKELKWLIVDLEVGYSVKAQWIKAVTPAKGDDPRTMIDAIYHYDDYYFQVLNSQSLRKLCSEIVDAIDYINQNEFNED